MKPIANLSLIGRELLGKVVAKPTGGTLSGHAAGEPFDKACSDALKKMYPGKTYRQYEYLNSLFMQNPNARTAEQRRQLVSSRAVSYLLMRGEKALREWSPDNLFEEKQNDTADVLLVDKSRFELIDVKTKNLAKQAQPPNIISASKVAELCKKMLMESDFNTLSIRYLGIGWEVSGNALMCKSACSADLFRCEPGELYINWAAAMQIQFEVEKLGQNFSGNQRDWAIEYLRVFTDGAKRRSREMVRKFVEPYKDFIQ